jgi:hypothetical protein
MRRVEEWRGIVKVQRSIAGEPSVLIYSKDRSVQMQSEFGKAEQKLFKPCEVKTFYHARVINKRLVLGERAEWQTW